MEGFTLNTCCICRRELSHPVSVELGIGPVCGTKYHVEFDKSPDENREANRILAAILRDGLAEGHLIALRDMGYPNLAEAVGRSRADFVFEDNGDKFSISFPFDRDKVRIMQSIPKGPTNKRWDPQAKRWRFNTGAKSIVWQTLQRHASGMIGYSEKAGAFVI